MSQTASYSLFNNNGQDDKSNKINFRTLFDFSNLSSQVQNHLKNVYTCVLLSTFCATLGAYLPIIGWFNYPFLAFIGSIITITLLGMMNLNAQTQKQCFALMATTALFIGIYISPLINLAIDIDPQIVMTAFLLTTLIFLCFTISALMTKRRTYLYLGGLLATGTSVTFLLCLMNLFGHSELIFNVNLYLGLFLACGYILYDTQLIIERNLQGDMNYVNHALLLFIDFVDLFVHILIILLKNSSNKNKKSNNR